MQRLHEILMIRRIVFPIYHLTKTSCFEC